MMDTGKKSNGTVYYGVFTPNENRDLNSAPSVFEDKVEALKMARKNKKSRFKAFQFYHEAVEFAQNGSEFPNNNTATNGSLSHKLETAQIGEKASPFKGPKPQELVELRKAIESGNYKFVEETIWQNPRYLVSSGDTPSILQEGARYNALHVAAKSKNAEVTELILNTVSSTDFVKLLYGDDNQENAEDRTAVLLDLYLNTPNKALNETPLHFASKHGAAEVVEILVSYPQCDKTLKNKFQKTADQVVCDRAELKDVAAVKRKIELLLQDGYYVPVLRAEDKSMPPLIGEPFSPTSPPVLNQDPLSPRLEIHAYAGPMDKRDAQEFRKVWKTPPRSLNSTSNRKKLGEPVNLASLRFKDPDKGLERIGKRLANKYDVNWKEYWHFLGGFVDITSGDGLRSLENYLANRYAVFSNSLIEEVSKNSPELKKSDILSPISDLCAAFSACSLTDSRSNTNHIDDKNNIDEVIYIDTACQVFANRISNDLLYILCCEDNVVQTLETEIKQLELLISSYMDDSRFSSLNFQKIHSRLGFLIGQKLYSNIKEEVRAFLSKKIESLLDSLTKTVDCFSSDDESHNCCQVTSEHRKPTIHKKQLICLIHYILNVLCQSFESKQIIDEDELVRKWENADPCTCVYHMRKLKKNSLSRSSSFKSSLKFGRSEAEIISRKLSFDESDGDLNFVQNGINLSKDRDQMDLSSEEDDDLEEDTFYTPPSSPSLLEEIESESDEDEFNDSEVPKNDVFIEGEFPTKVDCDVFNALSYAEVELDCTQYPNIYRWHHCISLYTAAERESWQSLKKEKDDKSKLDSSNASLNCSFSVSSANSSTPSKSWLRITGANSPKSLFKSNSVH